MEEGDMIKQETYHETKKHGLRVIFRLIYIPVPFRGIFGMWLSTGMRRWRSFP